MSQYFRILLSTLIFYFFFSFDLCLGFSRTAVSLFLLARVVGLWPLDFLSMCILIHDFLSLIQYLFIFENQKNKGETCLTRFELWKQLLTEPIRAGPTRFVSVKVSQNQTPDKMTCEVLIETIALTATQARHSMMIGLVVMDTCPDIYSWLADLKPI